MIVSPIDILNGFHDVWGFVIPNDEGMTDGPPTFAYLVFGPDRVSQERLSRPIKAVA
jgi:hypothetical protein